MTEQTAKPCPFCQMLSGELKRDFLFQGSFFFAITSVPQVKEGHVLVIPKRHVASFFDFTEEERIEFHQAMHVAKTYMQTNYLPDAINIGMNDGTAAGQTVMHQHTHLFARHNGDVPNPRGGIVNFFPASSEWVAYINKGQTQLGVVAVVGGKP